MGLALFRFRLFRRMELPLLFSGHEQVGQEHGDGRDIGDKHERDKHRDIEWNTAS